MAYHAMNEYKLLGFRKATAKGKMYYAVLVNIFNNKIIRVNFGDNKMQNYRDITGLNAYPHLIHNDNERRKRFKARHKGFLKKGYYSPSYFSYNYLW